MVGNGEDGYVIAKVANELRLRAEGERADVRMQAIGPDDEIEGARQAAAEGDLDAGRVLTEGGDRVIEDVFGIVAGGFVENAGQVAAQNFDFPTGKSIGRLATFRFALSTMVVAPVRVCTRSTSGRMPIRSRTCMEAPRKSTAYPPGRIAGARSTTVGRKP